MSKNQNNNKSDKKFKKLSPKTKERIRNRLSVKHEKENKRRAQGLPKTSGYIGGKTKKITKTQITNICKKQCAGHLKLFLKGIDKKNKKAFKQGFNKSCKIACNKKANSVINKTRKNQRGGMPSIFTNLGHSMGHSVTTFINTLNGVPPPTNPLPFVGHFPI